MFPYNTLCAEEDRVDPFPRSKLDYHNTIEAVLLPELAVRLIMEDKKVSSAKAHQIHVASRSFGVHAHPATNTPAESQALDRQIKQEDVDLFLEIEDESTKESELQTVYDPNIGKDVYDLTADSD